MMLLFVGFTFITHLTSVSDVAISVARIKVEAITLPQIAGHGDLEPLH